MILSHSKKFIFIHIYKVAGTSIRNTLASYHDLRFSDFPLVDNLRFMIGKRVKSFSDWSIEHVKAKEIQEKINPEVFNSYYKFAFVRNPWDWQVSLYHFMLQMKSHRQHNIVKKMKDFDEYLNWRIRQPNFELQRDFIYSDDDKLLVDFVGKFESLQKDFDKICLNIGVKPEILPVKQQSEHAYYKEYYNDRSKDLVYKTFKADIDRFGYEF